MNIEQLSIRHIEENVVLSPKDVTDHMIKFDTTRFHVLHKHEIQKPYLVSYEKVIVVLIFHE